jgi:hypothetical protein
MMGFAARHGAVTGKALDFANIMGARLEKTPGFPSPTNLSFGITDSDT